MKEKAGTIGYYRGKSEIPTMIILDAKFKTDGASCLADEIRARKLFRPVAREIGELERLRWNTEQTVYCETEDIEHARAEDLKVIPSRLVERFKISQRRGYKVVEFIG